MIIVNTIGLLGLFNMMAENDEAYPSLVFCKIRETVAVTKLKVRK